MVNNLYPYIFKLFLDKESFEKFRDVVDPNILRHTFKEYHVVFSTIERLHAEGKAPQITVGDLLASILSEYPNLKPAQVDAYTSILQSVAAAELTPEVSERILVSLRRSQFATKLGEVCYRVTMGEADYSEIPALLEGSSSLLDAGKVEDPFVTSSLDELLTVSIKNKGLRWRLNTMNRMLGSLRTGDFGFLMARPETGKTTFLASEVSYMAEQTDRPILWFNNEEQGNKVMLRIYEASLGAPLKQLMKYKERADAAFHDKTGGRIKLVDDAILHRRKVEALVTEHKPALIVFDQLDKIKGFTNDRKDLELGSIYRWAREIAKQHAPVIAVCQASAEADWVRWLDMSHAANAKTEKQAEADWILGIGRTNREGFENERYLHLSKNKLIGDEDTDPNLRHGRQVVYIRPEIARYDDV